MLYLCTFAGRIGYVQNTLETLHLPYGSEHVFEYTLKANELHGGDYIDEPALAAKVDDEVLVVFVDINPDAKRPYLPLRKARLLRAEKELDRMYYTVMLLEHCTPEEKHLDVVQGLLKTLFGDKLYKRKDDVGSGYLVLYGEALDFGGIDDIGPDESPWLTSVKYLSKIPIFTKFNCVFTKLSVERQKGNLPMRKEIKRYGDATYDFQINKAYCAELDYYVPFHNIDLGTVIDVQFCSNPNEDSLTGAMLVQKMNLEQGKVKYKFIASTVGDIGELAFKVTVQTEDVKKPVYMAGKGATFTIKRSLLRYACIISVFLISFALNFGSLLADDVAKETRRIWYYISTTGLSLGIPLTAWLAAVLWNGKKK